MVASKKISDFIDMPEEEFLARLQEIDEKAFFKDPMKVLQTAGIKLKEGKSFQLINNLDEAKNLPEYIWPISNKRRLNNEDLVNITGGRLPAKQVLPDWLYDLTSWLKP